VGLVDEGIHFFHFMTQNCMISAKSKHYACMVDLLGRAGHLQEAENLIRMMFCKPNADVWRSLLGGCRIHGNVEMGEHAAQQLFELDPENVAGYGLLSDIYTAAGNWDLSANVQQQRKERGVKKQPGCTWIEVNNEVHTFGKNDQNRPQIIEIRAELKRLLRLMHDAGYVPDLCCMMWRKKRRCSICVTIVRNRLLDMDSSAQILVHHSA
jgi:pentatricopeptide repeat protein